MNNISKLQKSGKSVFLKQDIANILAFQNKKSLDMFLYRAKKSGDIISLQRGIYALGEYDTKELGCKLRSKSYISLESVLKSAGVIFQHYDALFFISDDSRNIIIENQEYRYSKISDRILLNPLGIEHEGNYSIASPERAICDRVYLSSGYYFDNFQNIDFDRLREISLIYNKRVQKEIISLQSKYETR